MARNRIRSSIEDRANFFSSSGVPIIDTAGQGYLMNGNLSMMVYTLTAGVISGANQLRCFQYVQCFQITIRRVRIRIATISAGQTARLMIYKADKTLLVDSGNFSTAVAATLVNVLATPVIVPPGVYWAAWACTDAVAQCSNHQQGMAGVADPPYQTPLLGTAANPLVAGAPPATLGAITPAGFNVPIAVWEP